MATVTRFEDLAVWRKAKDLANAVYALCRQPPLASDFGLRGQLQRAAVSVMSNIAEGFERETTPDFIHFLFIAKGSAGEVRSQLYLARDQGLVPDEASKSCLELARTIAGLIGNLVAYLKSKCEEEKSAKRAKPASRKSKTATQPEASPYHLPDLPETASPADNLPWPWSPLSPDPFDL